jgi:hypothetical protein
VRLGWAWVRCGSLAAGATMVGEGWEADDRLFTLGVGVCLAAVGWLLAAWYARPLSDAYEQGHQAGFDKGYCEGRRVARPVVVDLTEWDEKVS